MLDFPQGMCNPCGCLRCMCVDAAPSNCVVTGRGEEMGVHPLLLTCVLLMACYGCGARRTGLPFSWDTLGSMRYSFCGNVTGPLNDDAVEYLSKQPIFLIGDAGSYQYPAEQYVARQSRAMKARNPAQKIWSYFAIDWVRPVYAASTYLNANADKCLLKDKNGKLVKAGGGGVYDFANPCTVEMWIKSINDTVTSGDTDGVRVVQARQPD
jgi:hypothetical protein